MFVVSKYLKSGFTNPLINLQKNDFANPFTRLNLKKFIKGWPWINIVGMNCSIWYNCTKFLYMYYNSIIVIWLALTYHTHHYSLTCMWNDTPSQLNFLNCRHPYIYIVCCIISIYNRKKLLNYLNELFFMIYKCFKLLCKISKCILIRRSIGGWGWGGMKRKRS